MSTAGAPNSSRIDLESALAVVHRARVRGDERGDRLPVELLGDERHRRRQAEGRHDPDLVGRAGGELP